MNKELRLSDGAEWRHLGEIARVSLGVVGTALVGWFLGVTFLGEGENVLLAFIVEKVKSLPTSVWVGFIPVSGLLGLMIGWMWGREGKR